MEPVFVALGEVCGIAAHLAIRRGVEVRHVPVGELQTLLVERRGVITFYDDLPFTDEAFAAFQWLGARGLNVGYRAVKDERLTRTEAAERLERILKAQGQVLGEAARKAREAVSETRLTEFATKVYQALRPAV
jgi:hypothetical protein